MFLWSPLHYNALNGHLRVAKYLVDHGAEIDSKNSEQCTPLHISAEYNHLSLVDFLVHQGADINSMDYIDDI